MQGKVYRELYHFQKAYLFSLGRYSPTKESLKLFSLGGIMMLNKKQMEQDLKVFLVEDLLVEFEIEDITPNMSLGNDLSVDSLGFTELMAHIEDVYKIKISDEEFVPENFRTINAIIELVEKKLNVSV